MIEAGNQWVKPAFPKTKVNKKIIRETGTVSEASHIFILKS